MIRKKRIYKSDTREASAAQTRLRILEAAKMLFISDGFECVTIEKLAQKAEVSAPTIYALFQSKRGILRALMDEALPTDQREELVEQNKQEKDPKKRLAIAAKIARQMYDAESTLAGLFQGASLLAPEFKELEKERELRRYERQEAAVKALMQEGFLQKGLSMSKARDISWAFTGRDFYRMLVIEQGWSSDEYENWLAELLVKILIQDMP